MFQAIMRADFAFPDPEWTDISSDAKDLVVQMLQADPDKRISADGVLGCAWITENVANGVDLEFGASGPRTVALHHAQRNLTKLTGKQRFRTVSRHDIDAIWIAFSPSGLHSSQDYQRYRC